MLITMENNRGEQPELVSFKREIALLKNNFPNDATLRLIGEDDLNYEALSFWLKYEKLLKVILSEEKNFLQNAEQLQKFVNEAGAIANEVNSSEPYSAFHSWLNNRLSVVLGQLNLAQVAPEMNRNAWDALLREKQEIFG